MNNWVSTGSHGSCLQPQEVRVGRAWIQGCPQNDKTPCDGKKLSISFLLEALLKPRHIIQESTSVTGWKMVLWRRTSTTNHTRVWKMPEGWPPTGSSKTASATDPGLFHTQNYFKELLSFSNVRWLLTDLKKKECFRREGRGGEMSLAREEIVRDYKHHLLLW